MLHVKFYRKRSDVLLTDRLQFWKVTILTVCKLTGRCAFWRNFFACKNCLQTCRYYSSEQCWPNMSAISLIVALTVNKAIKLSWLAYCNMQTHYVNYYLFRRFWLRRFWHRRFWHRGFWLRRFWHRRFWLRRFWLRRFWPVTLKFNGVIIWTS